MLGLGKCNPGLGGPVKVVPTPLGAPKPTMTLGHPWVEAKANLCDVPGRVR